MAEEEKKITAPSAFIDYDGDSDNIESKRWTANNLEDYWGKALVKNRKLSAHPWSIKVKSLAKRMLHEFETEDLLSMIRWWTEKAPIDKAPVFEFFYTKRYEILEKVKPKDYSEWEL